MGVYHHQSLIFFTVFTNFLHRRFTRVHLPKQGEFAVRLCGMLWRRRRKPHTEPPRAAPTLRCVKCGDVVERQEHGIAHTARLSETFVITHPLTTNLPCGCEWTGDPREAAVSF